MKRAWVITLRRYEHHEVTGDLMSRHEEVERLSGDLSRDEVERHLELKYARLYQPRWDEVTSTVDEKAERGPDGEIQVGHEPKFVARLVEAGGPPGARLPHGSIGFDPPMAAIYRLVWMIIGAAVVVLPAVFWWHWPWWGDVVGGLGGAFVLAGFLAGAFEMAFLGGRAPGGGPPPPRPNSLF